ncbi:MAG: translation elongation factor Ts [Planctomycetes bacterium]|nr:translation elongation factor Ts [Planctomycetota bacterium]
MGKISATLVKQLRDRTQAPMGDCKDALVETDGDLDKAVDLLRAKTKVSDGGDRSTAEGAVRFDLSDDKRSVAIVELCCETDFAARNENFQNLLGLITKTVLEQGIEDTDAALKVEAIAQGINEASSMTIHEAIKLGHAECRKLEGEGEIGTYVHHNGSVGVAVAVNAKAGTGSPELQGLLRDLAMHITAHDPSPVAVDRDGIPADLVAREKAVYLQQIEEDEKDRGKPENIKEKMVEGRLRKFYSDRALLEQKFVKNPEQSIKQLLEAQGKALGGEIKVAWFVRRAVGG